MSLLKRHDLDRFVQRLLSLHSTMSLLKRKLRNNLLRAGLRFTFHYVAIKTPSHRGNPQKDWTLHSTMSLLKLCLSRFDVSLISGFTFHYVAIKTRNPGTNRKDVKNFTFHYVAIKT